MADLLAMAVDSSIWMNLLAMPASELKQTLESKELREDRPKADESLERRHDVDVEAEILDWVDTCGIQGEKSTLLTASEIMVGGGDVENIAEGIWLLAEWASRGTWRCMEGRGFLYLEPYIDGDLEGVGELYSDSTWVAVLSTLQGMTPDEYAEAVVLDWMARREDLGETLDQKQDPLILSTMQSHQRLAKSLHRMSRMIDQESLTLLSRREWSSYLLAGFGGFNIGTLLSSAVKEGDS
ncbi:MAG: hypothetical protein QF831_00870 [Candidatus Thalassarchaeaceae archaeon]|nr:hypothetical protein [Candidatus Thalassarchaeaceae archaeon]